MSLMQDLAELMNDTITWRPLVSRDSYGVPTFGTGKVYNCRLVLENKLVRNIQGQLVTSTAHVWFGPPITSGDPDPPAVKDEDQLEFSSGDQPTLAQVQRIPDESGSGVTKVYFL